jgi:hypothetical protein
MWQLSSIHLQIWDLRGLVTNLIITKRFCRLAAADISFVCLARSFLVAKERHAFSFCRRSRLDDSQRYALSYDREVGTGAISYAGRLSAAALTQSAPARLLPFQSPG